MARTRAVIGIAHHAGWAVAVTVADGGEVVDRRRIELIDDGLPSLAHHHDAQRLPMDEAEALIERVRISAHANAARRLEELAAEVSEPITGITMVACPELPPTVAERITNYRAQNVADSVLFRMALAEAASARGWSVHWYDKRSVFTDDAAPLIEAAGDALGPPWQKDHRMAMAAAIAVLGSESSKS